MQIKQQHTATKLKKKENSFSLNDLLTKEITLGKKFNNKQKELFYNELNVLLKSGINLKNALELLSETHKNAYIKNLIETTLQDLVSGKKLSEIIGTQKEFTKYEYHAIKIGEQTGKLDTVLNDLSNFYKQKNEQQREISSALTYPIIVLMTSVIVVFFMLKYVVPLFQDIFKQNKVSLPWITQKIVDFSNFISNYGLWLLLLLTTLPFIYNYISKQQWFKKTVHYLALKIPIVGTYVQKIYLAQLTQAMALLTSSKITVVESLQLVSQMIQFTPIQDGLQKASKVVIQGEKLSQALKKHSVFEPKMIAMIRVAEETNQTEYIFTKLSEQYNTQLKYQSQIISSTLNPILTIMVGVLVGVILISMYLPMFQLSSVIK